MSTIVELQSTNVKPSANFKILKPVAMCGVSKTRVKTNDYCARPAPWLARRGMAFTELFRR
jgi:hypothetical protein